MNFEHWNPVYEAILADFGYGRAGDERARDRLRELLDGRQTYDPERLDWTGETVAIAGGAESLTAASELQQTRSADVVVAASVAADRLLERDIAIDCMVTDLDKNPDTATALTECGVPVAAHAHGDNIPAVEEWVPQFDSAFVIPTTQAAPTDAVHNLGGFTDGDRAAFLADAAGADRLCFPGWSFDDPTVGAAKRQKLRWAERLLFWLESRRNEQFDLLDGRRERIDTTALPVN